MISTIFAWAKAQYPYHKDMQQATLVAVEYTLEKVLPELHAWQAHGLREGYVAVTEKGRVEVVRK
jgi:hypothetical protein